MPKTDIEDIMKIEVTNPNHTCTNLSSVGPRCSLPHIQWDSSDIPILLSLLAVRLLAVIQPTLCCCFICFVSVPLWSFVASLYESADDSSLVCWYLTCDLPVLFWCSSYVLPMKPSDSP